MTKIKSLPYYELPVYKTTRELYKKMSTNKTLESIPKGPKKRMVEPSLGEMWDILTNIYEVRELEKQLEEQLEEGSGPLDEDYLSEQHKTAARLLLEARRKSSRCIIAIRTLHETKVSANDLRLLIPKDLYEDYSHDLVSIYRQLGFWAKKHRQ